MSIQIVQQFPRNRTFNISVGTAAVIALGDNSRRTKTIIQNNGAATVELIEDESKAFGSGFQIISGATYIDDAPIPSRGRIILISNGAANDVRIREEFNEVG